MKKDSLKTYSYTMIILSFIYLLPLAAISFYNRPSADDFNYSWRTYQTLKQGGGFFALIKSAFDTTIYYWHNWQGLYTSAFVLSLQPGIFGNSAYALTGLLMLFLIMGSTVYAAYYLCVKLLDSSKLNGIFLGCMMSFLMIQFMPSSVEGLFWFNGTMNYGLFYAILLLLICGLVKIALTQTPGIKLLILPILWGFLVEGGNHVTAFISILTVLFFAGISIYTKNRRKTCFYSVITLVMAVCFLFNVLSPGTKVRQAGHSGPGAVASIYLAIRYGTQAISSWLSLPLLFVLLLSLPVIYNTAVQFQRKKEFRFANPLLVCAASVAFICAMFCPPIYAMGVPGAGRLYDVAYYCFIFLVFANVFYICGYLARVFAERKQPLTEMNAYKHPAVILLLIALFIVGLDSWSYEALGELASGEAKVYAAEADEREKAVTQSTDSTIEFYGFSERPELLFFSDITPDPKDWSNSAYARYYGLDSVSIITE